MISKLMTYVMNGAALLLNVITTATTLALYEAASPFNDSFDAVRNGDNNKNGNSHIRYRHNRLTKAKTGIGKRQKIKATPKPVDGPEGQKLLQTTLDPSNYNPKRYNKKKNKYGMTLHEEEGEIMVRNVVKNSPAYNSGLQVKDIIISIDEKPMHLLRTRETLAVANEKNIPVMVTFNRPDKLPKDKKKTRGVENQEGTVREELASLRAKAAEARRKAAKRAAESEEQRQRRLQTDARRKAEARAGKTQEQLQEEQDLNTQRRAKARTSLTPDQRQEEQHLDTQRRAQARASLTPDQRQEEQHLDTQRRAQARASLTPDQLQEEQDLNTQQRAQARAGKTPEQLQEEQDINTQQRATARASLTQYQRQEEQALDTQRRAQARENLTPDQRQQEQEKDAHRKAAERAADTEEDREHRQLTDRTRKRFGKIDSHEAQKYLKTIEDLMEKHPSLREQKDLYESISFRRRAEKESIRENFERIKQLKEEVCRKQLNESPAEAVNRLEFYQLLDKYWVTRTQYAPRDDEEESEDEQRELYSDEEEAEAAASRRMQDIASRMKGQLDMMEGSYWKRKDLRRIKARAEQPAIPDPTPEQRREQEKAMAASFKASIDVDYVSCINCEESKRMSAGGYAKDSQAQKFTDKCLDTYKEAADKIDPDRHQKEEDKKHAQLQKKWMYIAIRELRKELEKHNKEKRKDPRLFPAYICHYCHGKIRKGSVPPISFYNDMRPDPTPPEMEGINDLEETLLALQTPFMRLLSLPAGAQHAIDGTVTNVPNDWNSVKEALKIPRNWDETTMVGVTMKRRTEYKSEYLSRFINPEGLWNGAVWLAHNNPEYVGRINLNPNWNDEFHSQQPELSERLIRSKELDVTMATPKKGQTKGKDMAGTLSRTLSRLSITPQKTPQKTPDPAKHNQPPYSPAYMDATSPSALDPDDPDAPGPSTRRVDID